AGRELADRAAARPALGRPVLLEVVARLERLRPERIGEAGQDGLAPLFRAPGVEAPLVATVEAHQDPRAPIGRGVVEHLGGDAVDLERHSAEAVLAPERLVVD